jgi:hypothetical protein
MKYEVVNRMSEEINIFEFTEMFNQAKPIFEVSTNLSFFEARVFNNILLLYEIQYYCRELSNENNHRYSLNLVLEIIQNKLHKYAILAKKRVEENICENVYYYIFYLK